MVMMVVAVVVGQNWMVKSIQPKLLLGYAPSKIEFRIWKAWIILHLYMDDHELKIRREGRQRRKKYLYPHSSWLL